MKLYVYNRLFKSQLMTLAILLNEMRLLQRNELEIIESDMKKKIAKEAARTQKRGAQKLTKKQRRNILAEEKAEKVVVELLRSRVEAEEAHNNDIMTKLLNGDAELRVPVKYGDMVQLMHMKSGRFLSVCEKAATYDPECRAANLATGSSAAQFKFMPRFKAQVVGNVVYFNDSLVLESSKQRGMHLHTSGHAYSLLCGENDPLLPKCLQKGRVRVTSNIFLRICFLLVNNSLLFDHILAHSRLTR